MYIFLPRVTFTCHSLFKIHAALDGCSKFLKNISLIFIVIIILLFARAM